MTSNFNTSNDSKRLAALNSHKRGDEQSSPCALDNLKRDRFELLSAYLDGEVTAKERYQVEDWLKSDPQIQCLYARLIQLRRGVQATSATALIPRTSSDTAQQVFSKLERRQSRRVLAWGGVAAAALLASLFSGNLPRLQYASNQIGSSSEETELSAETLGLPLDESLDTAKVASAEIPSHALMISLDQPLIEPASDGSYPQ